MWGVVAGLAISKLGSKYRQCAGSQRWPFVYDDGSEREMALASSLVPGVVFLWLLPLSDMFQDEKITSSLCASGGLQMIVFTLYVCRLFTLFFFSPRAAPMTSRLTPSQAHWTLKLQVLSLAGCKNSQKSAPLAFQVNCYGGSSSLCTSLCASLCLALLHNHGSLTTEVSKICFSPKLCLHTSYLLSCGLFSTFSCGVCFARLEADFWGM